MVLHTYAITLTKLFYFYAMAKTTKSMKSKQGASFKIDPDLFDLAKKKCFDESKATGHLVTFSSKMEELVRNWVTKKS
jgi:hypothetical protein